MKTITVAHKHTHDWIKYEQKEEKKLTNKC